MEICLAYISKYNSNREKQITLLMIPNEKVWHYLAVKKLSVLLGGIISKHNSNYFRTKNELQRHEKVCKVKDFFGNAFPTKETNILKADKRLCVIYAELDTLLKK